MRRSLPTLSWIALFAVGFRAALGSGLGGRVKVEVGCIGNKVIERATREIDHHPDEATEDEVAKVREQSGRVRLSIDVLALNLVQGFVYYDCVDLHTRELHFGGGLQSSPVGQQENGNARWIGSNADRLLRAANDCRATGEEQSAENNKSRFAAHLVSRATSEETRAHLVT
jgi:hypothetical protein